MVAGRQSTGEGTVLLAQTRSQKRGIQSDFTLEGRPLILRFEPRLSKKLFEIFDTDKNGTLDPTECARAIKELGRLSDHFFGVIIEPSTARQLDEFQEALKNAADIALAVPLDVRTSELHSLLGAMATLELRGSLAEAQLSSFSDKCETGTQSARGVELLNSQMAPLHQTTKYVREAVPRLEQRLLSQRNAASCLLTPKLVESVEKKEVAYQQLAVKEQAALDSVADVVSQVNEKMLKVNGGEPPPPPRQDEPVDSFKCGSFEAALPAPPEVRAALSRRWSSEGQPAPAVSPCRELGTLLLLLCTARKAASKLRALVEEAAAVAIAKTEPPLPPPPPDKGKGKKGQGKGGRGSISLSDGPSVREMITGPNLKAVPRACEKAQEDYQGDYCRLLDLLRVTIAFDSVAALLAGLRWLTASSAEGGTDSFEAVKANNRLTYAGFESGFDPERTAGFRQVVLNGYIFLTKSPAPGEARRLLVEVLLVLRPMQMVKGMPDAYEVLRRLDATDAFPPPGRSTEPVTKTIIERAVAGGVRRIEANRLTFDMGSAADDLNALLATEPCHLLSLQLTAEKVQTSTGRYLEKLLGVAYRGDGQYLVCTRLRVLQLGRNGLKGNVPTALGMCKALERLELHENLLEGKLPAELAAGTVNLKVLRLDANQLTSELPSEWGSPHLELLDVSHNLMYGYLPKALFHKAKLDTLSLNHNRFNGHLPEGEEAWLCTALRVLRLDHCRFQGPIPRALFLKCLDLEVCLLNNNTFSEEIPRTVGHCKQLIEFDVHANFLTGSVPCTQLKDCTKLKQLNFHTQRGEEPLIVMVDDGQKAALIAALPNCFIIWPGEEENDEAKRDKDKMLTDLTNGKAKAERERKAAYQNWKDAEEIAKKSIATLADLEAHLAKVKAKAEEGRAKVRADFETFMAKRDVELDVTTKLKKFEDSLK